MISESGAVVLAGLHRIHLVIDGHPVPKARPRTVRGKRKGDLPGQHTGKVHSFTPDETVRQERRIQEAWREAGSPSLDGSVYLFASFFFRHPTSHYNKAGEVNVTGQRATPGRGDIDNYLKLVQDALNGAAFEDDRLILRLVGEKHWCDREDVARTFIVISSHRTAT